jgi:hypothetical protein
MQWWDAVLAVSTASRRRHVVAARALERHREHLVRAAVDGDDRCAAVVAQLVRLHAAAAEHLQRESNDGDRPDDNDHDDSSGRVSRDE